MSNVVIIGCGIVGAAIAYELSCVPGLKITVLDKQPPAQGATSAALGVLMGAISHKIKGKAWQMRATSIQRYETLIPELEALTGRSIPFNRQGIVMLLPEPNLADWEKLVAVRARLGWELEIWNSAQLQSNCPHVNYKQIPAAVYSPQDRQVNPVALTLALVEAAQHRGVKFHFGVTLTDYHLDDATNARLRLETHPTSSIDNVDWLVVAAGVGSTQLQKKLLYIPQSSDVCPGSEELNFVEIKPVLGQALQLQLPRALGKPDFQPVITGNDVHIVPCGDGVPAYWVGATVEFPTSNDELIPEAAKLEAVRTSAIAFCPDLAAAKIVRTWSGLRPRPEGRPAPVIGSLPGLKNVLLATGHYRNGVLLAPATAQMIRQIIC